MALSKRGINRLEKIMLANKKYYAQQVFGRTTDCGTECCAAGFCRLMAVGKKQFDREVQRNTQKFSWAFGQRCVRDGKALLGLKRKGRRTPSIFCTANEWPTDLYLDFERAKTPLSRVKLYIKMLRTRVNDDGSIREVPE